MTLKQKNKKYLKEVARYMQQHQSGNELQEWADRNNVKLGKPIVKILPGMTSISQSMDDPNSK